MGLVLNTLKCVVEEDDKLKMEKSVACLIVRLRMIMSYDIKFIT